MTLSQFKTPILVVLTAGFFVALALAHSAASRSAHIGAAYKAKIACSEIFVAGRKPDAVLRDEFQNIDPFLNYLTAKPDLKKQQVSAAGPLGLGRATAQYREGYGCTLKTKHKLAELPKRTNNPRPQPWPEAPAVTGKALPYVDYAALDFALTEAFDNKDAQHRAILVIVDGKIVEERYAEGFDAQTPLLSWSMAKSVTASLVGAAALKGIVDIDDPAPVREWTKGSEHARIRWRDLLQMQDGLDFVEDYGDTSSDVNRMLFAAPDAGAVAAAQPVAFPPGLKWAYSSGTTNLVSRTLCDKLEQDGIDLRQFAYDALFTPIGAGSFILEPDAEGNFISSSFVYATARDWARLGQLYLQEGVWNGERLLPAWWIEFVRSPAAASNNQYGGHFWLNRDGENGVTRFAPGVPEDMYYMSGHEGQYVFIIPSKNMIVVRAGITRLKNPPEVVAPLLKEIYTAVGNPEG